jgi:hypothetical protein
MMIALPVALVQRKVHAFTNWIKERAYTSSIFVVIMLEDIRNLIRSKL